jgi:hypothetical protein
MFVPLAAEGGPLLYMYGDMIAHIFDGAVGGTFGSKSVAGVW